jgi:hypothetical protein
MSAAITRRWGGRAVLPVREAFTLVEILLALALAAMLLGGVAAYLWQVREGRDRLVRISARLGESGVLVESLEQDLLAVVARAPGLGSGVRGTSTGMRLATRGVWFEIADPAATGAPGDRGRLQAAVGGGDLQASEYTFDADARRVLGRRWSLEPGRSPPPMQVIAEGVRRVRFRYHDGREWLDQFDSTGPRPAADGGDEEEGLPVAIEVAVWFEETVPGREPPERWPEPDRLRVMSVPDGPVAAWARTR